MCVDRVTKPGGRKFWRPITDHHYPALPCPAHAALDVISPAAAVRRSGSDSFCFLARYHDSLKEKHGEEAWGWMLLLLLMMMMMCGRSGRDGVQQVRQDDVVQAGVAYRLPHGDVTPRL